MITDDWQELVISMTNTILQLDGVSSPRQAAGAPETAQLE